jgi:phage recombination protein Bet
MTVTDIATRPTGGNLSEDQVALVKRTICKGATDDELSMFVQTAQRLGLDPFARQVFAVKRWDSRERREVMSIQVSIDGFRLVAERTGKYAGQLGPLWSADGKEWLEVWLSKEPPAAAKVAVLRNDFKEPLWGVATWDQYKQTNKEGNPTAMWGRMGPLMLAKCAESLALRRAFPNELSGAYTAEEMAQATPPEPREEYAPPGPKGDAGTAVKPAVTGQPAPSQKPVSTTSPKPPKANTVAHDGTFASAEQVKLLHILRGKVGGLVVCGDKNPCSPPKRCAYHVQLAAFKDCDGKPISSSKDLSDAQIMNLIGRYKAKIDQQGARAAEPIDIGAMPQGFSRAESSKLSAIEVADLRTKLMDQDFDEMQWCPELFGVDRLDQLDKAAGATALQLLLARAKGPDDYDYALEAAREKGLVPPR